MTCKLVNLTLEDMEYMTIGECLDYAENYISLKSGKTEDKARTAKQEDFNTF